MKIMLDRDEYINLRPNALKDTLIGEIKDVIAKGAGFGMAERVIDDIKEKLAKYDRHMERQEEDPNLLW